MTGGIAPGVAGAVVGVVLAGLGVLSSRRVGRDVLPRRNSVERAALVRGAAVSFPVLVVAAMVGAALVSGWAAAGVIAGLAGTTLGVSVAVTAQRLGG